MAWALQDPGKGTHRGAKRFTSHTHAADDANPARPAPGQPPSRLTGGSPRDALATKDGVLNVGRPGARSTALLQHGRAGVAHLRPSLRRICCRWPRPRVGTSRGSGSPITRAGVLAGRTCRIFGRSVGLRARPKVSLGRSRRRRGPRLAPCLTSASQFDDRGAGSELWVPQGVYAVFPGRAGDDVGEPQQGFGWACGVVDPQLCCAAAALAGAVPRARGRAGSGSVRGLRGPPGRRPDGRARRAVLPGTWGLLVSGAKTAGNASANSA